MKYIIDEEELKGIYESAYYDCEEHNWRMTLEIKAFLKFKQPVELVASIETIGFRSVKDIIDFVSKFTELLYRELSNNTNIKIYIQKVKEKNV